MTVPVTGVTAATAAAVPGASHRGAVATAANGASEIEAGDPLGDAPHPQRRIALERAQPEVSPRRLEPA